MHFSFELFSAFIADFLRCEDIEVSPTIRYISVTKIPVIFDLNHSLQEFDKPGVADASFRYPNRICKKSIAFDSLNSLNISQIR